MLQGRNYEIIKDEDVTVEPWYKLDIVDTNTKEKIIRVRGYGEQPIYKLIVGNKPQTIEYVFMRHLIREIEELYIEQERSKARKEEEEAAAKFEQKKNAVYQNLFNIINPNVKK